ncbi:hypothetical protein ACSMX9_12315 [Streptomyces sp. LE64]|jgi:hypothetical protein|uniref:hypothetical protein n=1 Tax=unclassified Streptomyces TaxID=2593676 RepID=UPI00331D6B2F
MKPLKAAAVVAGSFALVGAAAPAFAADPMPTSLNGALEAFTSQSTFDARALHTNAIDTEKEGTLMNNVQNTADRLNARGPQAGSLLGGLPVGK